MTVLDACKEPANRRQQVLCDRQRGRGGEKKDQEEEHEKKDKEQEEWEEEKEQQEEQGSRKSRKTMSRRRRKKQKEEEKRKTRSRRSRRHKRRSTRRRWSGGAEGGRGRGGGEAGVSGGQKILRPIDSLSRWLRDWPTELLALLTLPTRIDYLYTDPPKVTWGHELWGSQKVPTHLVDIHTPSFQTVTATVKKKQKEANALTFLLADGSSSSVATTHLRVCGQACGLQVRLVWGLGRDAQRLSG